MILKKLSIYKDFLNDTPYEIRGIDAISNVNLGKGFIELKAQQSLLTADDHLDNDIANNEGHNWGAW